MPSLDPSKFGVGGTVRQNFFIAKDFFIELCSRRYLVVDMLLTLTIEISFF